MKKKITIIASIFLVLALMAGVSFLFVKKNQKNKNITLNETEEVQNVNDEARKESTQKITEINEADTTNWKTYKNEEFGFEVRYPESWSAELKDEKIV